MSAPKIARIDATIYYDDGEQAMISLGHETDSAWGNDIDILWRTVPARKAMGRALHAAYMFEGQDDRPTRLPARVYRVGQNDPTPDGLRVKEMCSTADPEDRYYCTWQKGHLAEGLPHVAGTGTAIAAVWS